MPQFPPTLDAALTGPVDGLRAELARHPYSAGLLSAVLATLALAPDQERIQAAIDWALEAEPQFLHDLSYSEDLWWMKGHNDAIVVALQHWPAHLAAALDRCALWKTDTPPEQIRDLFPEPLVHQLQAALDAALPLTRHIAYAPDREALTCGQGVPVEGMALP